MFFHSNQFCYIITHIILSELAQKLGTSKGNLSNKLKRDNFSKNELIEIGNTLDCDFTGSFKMKDTGDMV